MAHVEPEIPHLSERRHALLAFVEQELLRDEVELRLLANIDRLLLANHHSPPDAGTIAPPLAEPDPVLSVLHAVLPEIKAAVRASLVLVAYRIGSNFRVVSSTATKLAEYTLPYGGHLAGILEDGIASTSSTRALSGGDALHEFGESYFGCRVDADDEPYALLLVFTPPDASIFDDHAISFLDAVGQQLRLAHMLLKPDQPDDLRQLFDQVDPLFFSPEVPDQPHAVGNRALSYVQDELERLFDDPLLLVPSENLHVQILFPATPDVLVITSSTLEEDVDFRVSTDDSVSGLAVRTRELQVVADVSEHPKYSRFLGDAMRSECAIPVFLGTELVAVVNVESTVVDRFGGFPAARLSRRVARVTPLLAFARISTDLSESLERRHANEMFIAMGIQAANLLHRMNGKLGAVRRHLSRLRRETDDEATLDILDRVLRIIKRATEEPARIREDLSALATVDINEQVRLTLANPKFRRYVNSPDSSTATKLTTRFAADARRAQVFLFVDMLENIIDNALAACDARQDRDPSGYRGEVTIEVGMRLRSEDEVGQPLPDANSFVTITVIDNGVGLSANAVSNLYRPAVTSGVPRDKPEERSGLGLGLFLARNSVLRVGGTIDIGTVEGGGTRVEIQLPVKYPTGQE